MTSGEPLAGVVLLGARMARWRWRETLAGLALRSRLSPTTIRLAFSTFALDDPMPAIVDIPITLYRVVTRRLFSSAPAAVKLDPAKLELTVHAGPYGRDRRGDEMPR